MIRSKGTIVIHKLVIFVETFILDRAVLSDLTLKSFFNIDSNPPLPLYCTRYGQVDPEDAKRFAMETFKDTRNLKDQMYTVIQREYLQNVQSGKFTRADHELSRNSLMDELDAWAKTEQVRQQAHGAMASALGGIGKKAKATIEDDSVLHRSPSHGRDGKHGDKKKIAKHATGGAGTAALSMMSGLSSNKSSPKSKLTASPSA